MTHSKLIKHLEAKVEYWEEKSLQADNPEEDARCEASLLAYESMLNLVGEGLYEETL